MDPAKPATNTPSPPCCSHSCLRGLRISLGIIFILGAIIGTVALYSSIQNYSFIVGGVALLIGIALLCCGGRSNAGTKACDMDDSRDKSWLENGDLSRYCHKLCSKYPNVVFTATYPYPGNIEHTVTSNPTKNVAHVLTVGSTHWALVFIDHQQKTIEYYDSKSQYGNGSNQAYLRGYAQQLGYTFSEKIKTSIQPDDYECGPWVLHFAEKRAQGLVVTDQTEKDFDIAAYRKHVLALLPKRNG